jgi:hypothetical protein
MIHQPALSVKSVSLWFVKIERRYTQINADGNCEFLHYSCEYFGGWACHVNSLINI